MSIESDWRKFEAKLSYLGMRKQELAREFGFHAATISRWRHSGVPKYAQVYLSWRVRAHRSLLRAEAFEHALIKELKRQDWDEDNIFDQLQAVESGVSSILEGA